MLFLPCAKISSYDSKYSMSQKKIIMHLYRMLLKICLNVSCLQFFLSTILLNFHSIWSRGHEEIRIFLNTCQENLKFHPSFVIYLGFFFFTFYMNQSHSSFHIVNNIIIYWSIIYLMRFHITSTQAKLKKWKETNKYIIRLMMRKSAH